MSTENTIVETTKVAPHSPTIAFVEAENRGRDSEITPLSDVKKVSDTAAGDNEDNEETEPKVSKRNSFAAFVDRLRSPSRSRRTSVDGDTIPIGRTTTQSSVASAKSSKSAKSTSSRKSSRSFSWIRRASLEEQDEDAPYADVVRAQNEFVEKVRAENEKNGVTHNADGIPYPRKNGSRRSSVVHALGLDKPMLAF
ncbi:hypothetical protein BGZ80_011442 [Entomortierella chlamydospora]|uniref:Uncharacterized protein n=1 Tax=Entomortierella chlamydospora TaxID=101097 RepID=A0A9P6T3R1_9FUNG|nr:hypothetical protein BGZ79_004179 [Entomortierella chlamydospora]KAG0022707.1 hypothetical protein BGZ80_011442 [Entomortierella chlamydospora]